MTAYHVAPAAAREHIEREGLLASGPNPRWAKYGLALQPAGVYAWTVLDRASAYAEDFERLMRDPRVGACDVWAVDLSGYAWRADPVLGDQGAVYVPHSVPADRLALRESA